MPGFGGGFETAITTAAHRNKHRGVRVHDRISRPGIPPQWRTHDEDDRGLEAVGLVVRRNSTR